MSEELSLVYFNARGLAETSRILLALAQVEYEDVRYPLEIIDPVNHVYVRDQFDRDKKAGAFTKSMGKLPILKIKHGNEITEIAQSKAIERYISKRYGLMGKDLIEEAKIDSVCECIRDIKDKYQKISNSDSDSEKETYFKETLSNDLNDLVKVLDEGTKYAIGNKLSLADVHIYYLVSQYYENKEAVRNIAGNIPRIRDIVIKVASRPEVRIYLTDRIQTAF